MAQSFGQPLLVALATTILAHQKNYYDALEAANKQNDVTDWLTWFSAIALEAQHRTLKQVEFLIAKTRLLDSLRGEINERQLKALLRMLREGPDGFRGGLSASSYIIHHRSLAGHSDSRSGRPCGERCHYPHRRAETCTLYGKFSRNSLLRINANYFYKTRTETCNTLFVAEQRNKRNQGR